MLDNLFTPTHLVALMVIFGLPVLLFFAVRMAIKSADAARLTGNSPFSATSSRVVREQMNVGAHEPQSKYCTECGKQIQRRAEICPHCSSPQMAM